MTRRIALVLAALIVPGGLVALFGAAVLKAFSRTDTGRKAWGRVTDVFRRPPAPVQPGTEDWKWAGSRRVPGREVSNGD